MTVMIRDLLLQAKTGGTLNARVYEVRDVRTVNTKNGEKRVLDVQLADGTGQIKCSIWEDDAGNMQIPKEGMQFTGVIYTRTDQYGTKLAWRKDQPPVFAPCTDPMPLAVANVEPTAPPGVNPLDNLIAQATPQVRVVLPDPTPAAASPNTNLFPLTALLDIGRQIDALAVIGNTMLARMNEYINAVRFHAKQEYDAFVDVEPGTETLEQLIEQLADEIATGNPNQARVVSVKQAKEAVAERAAFSPEVAPVELARALLAQWRVK